MARSIIVGGGPDLPTPDVTKQQYDTGLAAILKAYRKGRDTLRGAGVAQR